MSKMPWYPWVRIGLALLTITAVVGQVSASWDRPTFRLANFFSFFTIESNVFAAIVLLAGTYAGWLGWEASPAWERVRGAAVAYMLTTGIVYAALLAGLPDDLDLIEPWVNVVLHQVAPVVMLLDWLLAPPRCRLTMRQALAWLFFPLAYCGYSLVRGPIVDWYPYPFLNPEESGGYAGVAAYALGIAVLFVGISWAVVSVGNGARHWWLSRGGVVKTIG